MGLVYSALTLSDTFVSITAMLLVSRPIASPILSCFLQYFLVRLYFTINKEQVDQRNILTLLQKKVKYGVPNMTAISICESVFNDRLLAIELAQILSDANIGTDKILNMLKAHSEEIFSCLDSYPEYFKDRLSVLMK